MESSQEEPDTEAFRAELRAWLQDNLTPEVVEAGGHQIEGESLEVLRAWNRTLADGGWAAPSWPVEHGGRGAGVPEQLAYLEETNRVRAPGPVNVIGVSNIAPAIMQFGTPEQQERFLQPMLRGDEIWSQGMSEPDAGSDLASLRTAAVEDGDDFVINGQKTWNSLGHFADWCQLYVRTDPTAKKHAGITCFLVDLRTPGHRGAAADHHHGRAVLRRALLHRRPRAPLGHARAAARRVVGGHDDAELRAGRRGAPRTCRWPTGSTTCWPTRGRRRAWRTRCCGSAWPASTRTSAACAS